MQRIAVIGTTGSGKTRLAAAVARHIDAPHIELDALHWGPDWEPKPEDELRSEVAELVSSDRWVCDGNYAMTRDLVWGRADAVVWLDYPLRVVLGRLTRRIWRRTIGGEPLWNGNRETLGIHLASRDSLYLWALKTHRRHRADYPAAFTDAAYAHLDVLRFRNPRQTAGWLESLPSG